MLKNVAVILAAAAFGFFAAWYLTEICSKGASGKPVQRSKPAAYLVCFLAVLAFSVLVGLVVGAPVYPGDEIESTGRVATEYGPPMSLHKRDELITNTFLVLIIPSLIGVRIGLGKKRLTAGE